MPLVVRWLIAFAFTQTVEAPIYVLATGNTRPMRERWAIALAASAITHPLVWYVIPELCIELHPWLTGWWTVLVSELFAVLAEALWLGAFRVQHAFFYALLANVTSFTLGLFLYTYLGW